MSGLTIYKASAGSGKTYTLVQEYMDLLLRPNNLEQGEELRDQFKKILIATFTNKATTELRVRIVQELLKRANQGVSEAMHVLEEILLDYSSFRVQTIDSFFQEVVRSFVFELNSAKAGAMIELNRDEAIEMSVDQLLAKLSPESSEWLTWIMQSELEEGKASDLRNEIITLAKQLLYHQKGEDYDLDLIEYEALAQARRDLLEVKRMSYQAMEQALESIKATLEPMYEHLDKSSGRFLLSLYEVTLDSLLVKLKSNPNATAHNGRVKVKEEGDFIFAKKHNHYEAEAALIPLQEEIRSGIIALNEALWKHAPDYYLADLLLTHLNLLPLAKGLKDEIDHYQLEHNILLIDEVNDLVRTIIADSSTPFLYEKVGGRIKHYMIDEFQDTNRSQWNNFSHLLEESLSRSHQNYLVGDVKQSIYRWRGTDSNILNNEVEADDRFGDIDLQDLVKNWRSDQYIVEFNNALFDDIYDFSLFCEGAESREDFKAIYQSGVVQEAQHNNGTGYVSFEYLPAPAANDLHDAQTLAGMQMSDKLHELINHLIESGYTPGDIVFIVRQNSEAEEIADILTQLAQKSESEAERSKYDFISDDALLITNSNIVKLVVALFRYATNPASTEYDLFLRATLAMQLAKPMSEVSEEADLLKAIVTSNLSLTEATYQILQQLDIPRSEELYVSSFLDLLYDFGETKVTTYQAFITWWDKSGCKRNVVMGDDAEDKIRIITIHKAKGLQFPVVIIPYLNWVISKSRSKDIEFCKPHDIHHSFPTPDLPFFLIPASISKANLNSKLGSKYREIHEENYLDNLNLLYVALTRPKHRLYIFTNRKSSEEYISKVVYSRIDQIASKESEYKWSYGIETSKAEQPTTEESVTEVHLSLDLPHNQDVVETIRDSVPFENKATLEGKLMHDTMARSATPTDFEIAVERLVKQGSKTSQEAQALMDQYSTALHNPIIKDWFTRYPYRTILTEQAVSLGQEGGIRRPDRVLLDTLEDGSRRATIIDFKFGEKQSPRHQAQVRNYMELFSRLGYHPRGFLWYWESTDQITEVTL